ncbi:hypothetical protein AAI_22477 [Pseudomonas viridiflava UASWS0038]|nr:hypothetical protein AAI_22477 [Pseudomonas viridiflava UASWS0038]
MKNIKKITRCARVILVQNLLRVKGWQGGAGSDKADDIQAQPYVQFPARFKQFQTFDIASRKAETRVRLEQEKVMQRLVISVRMNLAKQLQNLRDRLINGVLTDCMTECN